MSSTDEHGGPPLVSIGVPVYNGERFLRESLESLLAQDYAPLDIVISDNASEDGSAAICREFAERDSRVRYRRNETNLGALANFRGLQDLAGGPYFMWGSDHDLWDPRFVSKLVEVLDADPAIVLAYGRTMLIDADGAEMGIMPDRVDTRNRSAVSRYAHLLRNLSKCNMMYGLMRLDALRALRQGLINIWCPDRLFLAELSLAGSFAQLDDTLFFRRENRPRESDGERKARVLAFTDPSTGRQKARRSLRSHYRALRNAHMRLVAGSDLSPRDKLCAMGVTYRCFWRSASRGVPIVDEAREEWGWRWDAVRGGRVAPAVKFLPWLLKRIRQREPEDY